MIGFYYENMIKKLIKELNRRIDLLNDKNLVEQNEFNKGKIQAYRNCISIVKYLGSTEKSDNSLTLTKNDYLGGSKTKNIAIK